jgi:hypothetical protein
VDRQFKSTELADGEKIVFGPVTFTQTTSLSGGAGGAQSSVSRTSGRMVGVTNQRVVVEDLDTPGKTQICANADVQRVYVKRTQRRGQMNLDLAKVQTTSGQTIKLGIKGLPARAENELKELFPNAEVAQDSKCFIATAAYGSALAPQVVALRQFRDVTLRPSWLGRRAIGLYEWASPPLADWIAARPSVRAWVRRLFLAPVVWIVRRLPK